MVTATVLMNRTVNDKGAIGAAKVVSDLLEKGYYVFLPFDGASPIDIVAANKEMSLRRIQIKYRKITMDKLDVPLASVVNGKVVPNDLSKIDAWAIYCPDNNKIYYVAKTQLESNIKNGFVLSFSTNPKVKRRACNYLDISVIWKTN